MNICKQCDSIRRKQTGYNKETKACYRKSENGKAKVRRYQQSDKNKAVQRRYTTSEMGRHVINKRQRERTATDPQYKMKRILRARLYNALKNAQNGVVPRKCARTLDLLGCTIDAYIKHIEQQFQPGMSWERHGKDMHIDHIKPCAAFDLTDPEQQKACFHYSNMQPLWAVHNLKKGAKFDQALHRLTPIK
jgi:hypothetical protein